MSTQDNEVQALIADLRELMQELGHVDEEYLQRLQTVLDGCHRWDAIETMMIIGDVELKQGEDGGYDIYLEPVENYMSQHWTGDTPEQVVDLVVAAFKEAEEKARSKEDGDS